MSKLEELIRELCPDGVEYKMIGEIATITRGRVMSKDYIKENQGEYPVYSSQTENDGEFGRISTYDFDGEFLTWTTDGANAGSVFYRNGKFSITNVCGLIKVSDGMILLRFLYFVLSVEAKRYVNSGMGNPKLMSNVMVKVKIPVPPLPVQREIVRILDNFTELTAELQEQLTTELIARKKQYEYYKRQLLDDLDAETVPFNKVCNNIFSGRNKVRLADGKYPVYGSTGIISTTNTPAYSKEQILIARVGANAGFVHIANGEYDVSDNTLIVDLKDGVSLKYIYYQLASMNLHQYAKGGGQPLVTAGQIKELKIAIPTLEKQLEIVFILDRFDVLCNDLTSGLPAEIEARQKQYEYYRDKLLTFQPLEKGGAQ